MLTKLPPLTFAILHLAGKFIELKLNSESFYSAINDSDWLYYALRTSETAPFVLRPSKNINSVFALLPK